MTSRFLTVPHIIACAVLSGLVANPSAIRASDDVSRMTVAEASNFESTCTSQECDSFVTAYARQSPHITKLSFGRTVDDRDLVAAIVARPATDIASRDGRLRILVIGNIHSGECAGKEALLMLLREISESERNSWLDNAVLVFVPNYNADANDRMAFDNRPGQIGPIKGMGRRENTQGLDLNRDFMKLESPEATALVRLMNDFDPHLFIDCHTTNGSKHRYDLTYDIPHNPATDPKLRSYLRQEMMPRVTRTLEAQGTPTFYYGNFNQEHTRWTTYGCEPRYSTEYYGLRGRLAILSEAYSYISFQERIAATKAFVTACLDDAISRADQIRTLLAGVDQQQVTTGIGDKAATTVSLAATVSAFPEPVLVRGYLDDAPHDYECQFFGDYVSTSDTVLPEGWLIPAHLTEVASLLQRHGIRMSQLAGARDAVVEVDRIDTINRSTRPFQGHLMQQATATRRRETRSVPQGTWLVPSDQPLARLAAYLLEPESSDGLVTWNVIDAHLANGSDYPIWRLNTSAPAE